MFFHKVLHTLLACSLSLAAAAHSRIGLEYVENKGQWDSRVLYRAGIGAGAVFLEQNRFAFSFIAASDLDVHHEFNRAPWLFDTDPIMNGHAWYMSFPGSQPAVVTANNRQDYYHNYFLGNDPSKWSSNVGVFSSVTYSGLYEGIDLFVHEGSGHFKYDFKVSPGTSPDAIRLLFEGLDEVSLLDGSLVLETSVGEFIENKPYAFQVVNGQIVEVPCNYVIMGGHIGFEFPDGYDTSRELIVDPELIASTLSGSTGASNYGHTATFDIAGNIYTGCIAFGAGYPTTAGAFQAAYSGGGFGTDFGLSKLNPDGSQLLWASYVGGSDSENPHSLWANDQGELFAYGSTSSTNFPTTPGAHDTTYNGGTDIVVCRLSADGTDMIGSTFIGGTAGDGQNAASVNYGDAYRGEIILDGNGKVLIASCSSSGDFPTTSGAYQSAIAGAQDAVFCRLNGTLTSLEVSTFIGSSGNDMGYGLRVNSNNQVYLAGMAGAADFPTTPGAHQTTYIGGDGGGWGGNTMDGFVLRFNGNASILQASTFLATTEVDQVFFMDLDNDDNVFVYGQGGDFPVLGAVYSDPGSKQFITKLNAGLTSVMLSTVVGSGGTGWGGTDFVPDAFLVDHCNNIYISSYQANGQLPTTPDALYTAGGFYLAVYSEDLAAFEYGTFYTGNHVDGGTSRFDKNGTVYQAVCSGGGFATTANAWAPTQSNGWDVAVFKIDFDVSGVNSAITAPDLSGCAPYVVQFQNFSTGDQFFWDFGDGTTSEEFEPEHTYNTPGVYDIMMIASDELSCNLADTSTFEISISTPVEYFPSFDYLMDCSTMTVTTLNTTGFDFLDFVWDMGDGTILEAENVEHIYSAPGDYEVTLQAIDNGCDSDESVIQTVSVFNEVIAAIPNADLEGCAPFLVGITNNTPGASYTWDFGDGSPLVTGYTVSHEYTIPGTYTLILYAEGLGDCVGSDQTTSEVVINEPAIINADFDVNQITECVLLLMEGTNLSEGADLTYFWTFGDGISSSDEDVSHTYSTPGNYTVTLTIEDGLCGTQDVASTEVTLIDQIDLQLPPFAFICYYEDAIELQAVDPGLNTTYEWSTGATTSSIAVSEPGDYSVTAFFNNCEYTHELTLDIGAETPTFETVEFCEGSNQFIEIPAEGSSYSWCTGETEQGITVENGGEYCFEFVDENGCLQEGLIVATMNDYQATVYVPNAFTPNDDGINDVFAPSGVGVNEYELKIWNRWGEEIFTTKEFEQPWDGSFKGNAHYVPDGIYTYLVRYKGECASERVEKVGVIMIVR